MEHTENEPISPARTPRACSTPHSAPVEWLKDASPANPPAALPAPADEDPDLITPEQLDDFAAALRASPTALAEFIERLSPDETRLDGWSPFCRRLFLQVLAETGQVKTACEYTGLTRQSAYALAARDPLFAAGWDAAAMLARRPLADDIFEKSVDGVTDTITRNGQVVATRHRYDARLSIAVLNRLDRRCERAEERGDKHLALMRHWDEWLVHVGKGDEKAARALLESPTGDSAKVCQPCQLAESEEGADATSEVEEFDLDRHFWRDEDGVWMTDFRPPAGFSGHESGEHGEDYQRDCTEEEQQLLDGVEQLDRDWARAENERERDEWLAALRKELGMKQPKVKNAAVPPAPRKLPAAKEQT